MFHVNQLTGFGADGRPPPTISYRGSTGDASNLTVYTFPAHDIGTAGSYRSVIVGITGFDAAAAFNVTGVMIGGGAAAEVVDSLGTGVQQSAAIYILDVASGTTADIEITWSEAVGACAISVWAAYDLLSTTETDSASANGTSGASLDLSLNIAAGGVAVGVCGSSTAGATATWTGLTERVDTNIDHDYTGADTTQTSAQAPLAASVDYTGSGNVSGCAASFR